MATILASDLGFGHAYGLGWDGSAFGVVWTGLGMDEGLWFRHVEIVE